MPASCELLEPVRGRLPDPPAPVGVGVGVGVPPPGEVTGTLIVLVNEPAEAPMLMLPEMLEPSVVPNENVPEADVVTVPTMPPSIVMVTSHPGGKPDPVMVMACPGVTEPLTPSTTPAS